MNGVTITWGLLTKIATSHVGLGLMVCWLITPFVWWQSKEYSVCAGFGLFNDRSLVGHCFCGTA